MAAKKQLNPNTNPFERPGGAAPITPDDLMHGLLRYKDQLPTANGQLAVVADGHIAAGAFVLTPRGLIAQGEASEAEWEAVAALISRLEGSIVWLWADWCLLGEFRYNQTYQRLSELSGYKVETLRNMASVARRIEISRRRYELPFGHHDAVAALPPEQQVELLQQAIEHNYSVSELRYRAGEARPSRRSLADRLGKLFTRNQQQYQRLEKTIERLDPGETLAFSELLDREIESLERLREKLRERGDVG